MVKLISTYVIALLSFCVLDGIWLGVISKNYYKEKLGFILSPNINWTAAVLFYLLFIAGILFFSVNPALKDTNWKTALLNGAIFGGICYATYDLTNMATIAKWPAEIVIIDILWGMVLTASVSLITFFSIHKIWG